MLQEPQAEHTSVWESAMTARVWKGDPWGHGTSPLATMHAAEPPGATPAQTEASSVAGTEQVRTCVV
jgi:hypothetical protein